MSVAFEDRFWSKVEKTQSCWLWTAAKDPNGYGRVNREGRTVLAHRAAWELEHGEAPPDGLCVCHQCDVPACVRPEHLFLGTQADNLRDMGAKGRRRRGEDHHAARLSEADVHEIRRCRHEGLLLREIAVRFGVHKSTVRAIVAGCNWGWLS